ncbi:CASP-like protein 5C1 [Salvia hispanica]|uniref:CASP-like protein 5C1 n=1 Tax=Salvia hispanica TaxID=49212 RepID=UPI002009A3E1|nr:CASP-like protein 5C1 [Salvia hispanica]
MKSVAGSVGTSGSIGLRFGQLLFSSSSIVFMSLGVGFYSYTAFCFSVTIMGLAIPWSFTLAILDGYSILANFPVHQSGIFMVIIIGDLVLSFLALAAASSTASLADLLLKADVSFCPPRLCSRYQISAVMAFFSWILLLLSSLSNIWLLPWLDTD